MSVFPHVPRVSDPLKEVSVQKDHGNHEDDHEQIKKETTEDAFCVAARIGFGRGIMDGLELFLIESDEKRMSLEKVDGQRKRGAVRVHEILEDHIWMASSDQRRKVQIQNQSMHIGVRQVSKMFNTRTGHIVDTLQGEYPADQEKVLGIASVLGQFTHLIVDHLVQIVRIRIVIDHSELVAWKEALVMERTQICAVVHHDHHRRFPCTQKVVHRLVQQIDRLV